jgi:aryl-alcohol dehydrogenase-like predicted oxidoreductase
MARGEKTIPLPGGRTVAQVEENAKTLEFGPLSPNVMVEIETLMDRSPEGPPRNR